MTFLFILSIIVNMIAILAIITLYLRQNRLLHFEKNYKEYMKETEEIIHTFIIEMKEENEEIKQLFKIGNDSAPYEEKNESISKPNMDQEVTGLPQGYLQKAALNAYTNTNTKLDVSGSLGEEIEPTEKSLETDQNHMLNEVRNLKNQGRTIEEIAKSMGRGKTEIDLLLKLNQK